MTDHAEQAKRLLESFPTENRPAEAAQAYATLALAEQQRIANLIALDGLVLDTSDGGTVRGSGAYEWTYGERPGRLVPHLRPEVAKALGIES